MVLRERAARRVGWSEGTRAEAGYSVLAGAGSAAPVVERAGEVVDTQGALVALAVAGQRL
ncbi:hypothetical protein [Streptacidiphilus neutrinimicus]|uniref:hypothetical protein n=1 Tax=Streptacidiphilus neutrinimicus TaxID=105420 RepID=UPI0005A810EF|nr:hypothetical protein [Streptacidiphilus neutrinimicus]